jgi:murein endopeptidase
MGLAIILALRLLLAAPLSAPPAGFFPAEDAAKGDSQADADEADEGVDDAESEAGAVTAAAPGIHYTGDLSDDELARRWREQLDALGSISVGFADQGRLINPVHMPEDPAWVCARPDLAWGTQETVDSLSTAFRAVHAQFPKSVPARLSHIGAKNGGYLRPHKSHQSGRDADIAFFYKKDQAPGGRGKRERFIDPVRSWALLRALITQTDVQLILVDRGIQDVLRKYALAAGEDRAWLDRVFRSGKASIVQHARNHRDHFHARFFAPRSQELGRRIAPLLAQRDDQNLIVHRVKRGQTLGTIARVYATTVTAILKANRLHKTFLSLDQRLLIPLRKPCTRCPVPPAVVVPARCLPPT